MRISACYIVRDEAAKLDRSLSSIEGAVDEVVVVDTGSSDGTAKVAEAHGARVFSFPWRDDFSAARNVSLSKATGDWVLVVDADEYFAEAAGGKIRAAVERHGKGVDLLLFLRRELDEDTGRVILDSYVPRLLRRVDGLAYEGAIHEEPRHRGKAIERMAAIPGGELLMMHTGYSAALTRAKGERNLALLQKEMDGGHPRDSIYMYLAETYSGLDDDENAMRYAWLDVNGGRKAFAYASRSYRILLRTLAKYPERFQERRRAAFMAARDFPELPEFHAEYAECLGYGMDYRGALREANAALALAGGGSVSGLEPTMFGLETAELVAKRAAMWARRAKEEAGEERMRDRAGAGDWPGVLREAGQAMQARGEELFSLLLLMEADGSEAARTASAAARALLPPDMERVWAAYAEGAALDGAGAEVFLRMLGGVAARIGMRQAARLADMARAFPAKRRHEAAAILAEGEMWALALPLLEDAEGDALLVKGVCLYRLGDMEAAARAFSRLREDRASPEADAYLHWIGEALQNA